jgi:predicted helicase
VRSAPSLRILAGRCDTSGQTAETPRWPLDQYREKKPKDPTIRRRFDTYRFADYKDNVVDLLARVTTVSVKTTEIVEAMRRAKR